MMKRRKPLLLWLCLAVLSLTPFSASAQSASPCVIDSDLPLCVRNANLFYLDNGLIKQWNPDTHTSVDWDAPYPYNENPVISPDGRFFAYNSWANEAGDLRAEAVSSGYYGLMLSNIWVYDYELGDAFRIAAQPEGAFLREEGGSLGIVRSMPVWSPDSLEVAWTQLTLPDFRYQLAVHHVGRNETRIIHDPLPPGFQDMSFSLHVPRWGAAGLSILRGDFSNLGPQHTLTVYDALDGHIRYEILVGDADKIPVVHVHFANAPSLIGLLYEEGWNLLNLTSGTMAPAEFEPELMSAYSGLGNGASISLSYSSWDGFVWRSANVASVLIEEFRTDWSPAFDSNIAIAPDGLFYAHIYNGLLIIYEDWETFIAPTTAQRFGPGSGVIWGPTHWLISLPEGSLLWLDCSQETRLSFGMTAYVVPGMGSNALRDAPGLTRSGSTVIGEIPENGEMRLLDGPTCVDGYLWWFVDHNGQRGWTAEGEGNTIYWLAER